MPDRPQVVHTYELQVSLSKGWTPDQRSSDLERLRKIVDAQKAHKGLDCRIVKITTTETREVVQ